MRSGEAGAKLNLGLHVLRKRSDGYHDIETVFLPIGWSDTVTVEREETLSFMCDDDAIEGNDNLCFQAARMLREAAAVDSGARIHLVKRIPYGAGLGGGSSDAAATLRLLADLWDIRDRLLLERIGAELGADVPFFLQRGPAFGSGRGDALEPLVSPEDSWSFPFQLVVVVPSVRVSTAEAYRAVTPSEQNRPDLVELVVSLDPRRWRQELVNDFERPVLEAFPEISSLKRSLYDAGADYASMSGSGSAVYGVFEDPAVAEAAAAALRTTGHVVWVGRGVA